MVGGNILLVDDDEDDQFIFKDALKELAFSFDCLTACNGLEGFTVLANEQILPRMIFLDLNMPLMNGREFLIKIKNNPVYRHIPVTIFSTSNNPADKENMLRLGASLFITKTSNFKKLKSLLLDILMS